jgi:AraC-like DNA-binding protein
MKLPLLLQPAPELRRYVHHFWNYDGTTTEKEMVTFRILSDGLPGLIFQHQNGRSAVKDETGTPLPTSFVYGQATQSFTNLSRKQASFIGVSLKAESLPLLFGTCATTFTNNLFPLNDIASYNVNDRLLNTSSPMAAVKIISEFLLNNIRSAKGATLMVADSLERMHKTSEKLSLPALHKHYNVSERHFERSFKAAIGIRPCLYYRIVKFQKAIRQMQAALPQKLSDIAYDLEYADQSHFIRDFKAFSGFSPKEFLRQNLSYAPALHNGFPAGPVRLVQCN